MVLTLNYMKITCPKLIISCLKTTHFFINNNTIKLYTPQVVSIKVSVSEYIYFKSLNIDLLISFSNRVLLFGL